MLLLALDQLRLLLEHSWLLDLLSLLKAETLQELLLFPLQSCLSIGHDHLLLGCLLMMFVEDLPLLLGAFEPEAHVPELEVGPGIGVRVLLALIVVVVDAFVVDELAVLLFVAFARVILLAVAVAVGLTAG